MKLFQTTWCVVWSFCALHALLTLCASAQDRAVRFKESPALAEPAGDVVSAKTVNEIFERAESLAAGATLLIEPGVYQFDRPLVLRGRKNVTIRSVSGDPTSVTLKGLGWEKGNDLDDILRVAACDGVMIAGLTFAESRSYGIKVEAEHAPKNIHIYNCDFRNIGVRAIKGSASQDPMIMAENGSVRFCDFENNKVPPANWLFGGDYISAIDMMALDRWTFSDNTFRNINGRNGGGRAAIFIWVRSRRIVVERNVILNCDRGISFGNPGVSTANLKGEQTIYVSEGIIQNNMISGGVDCGIELWHAKGIKVRHNSILRPERNWNRGIRIGAGVAQTEVVNNLVDGGIQVEGGDAQVKENVAKRIEDYFVEPANGNLALTAKASDAINRGVKLDHPLSDIRGLARDGEPDFGAWEFEAKAAQWIEPMKKVHARFKGKPGTFAQFGDSITFSGAFWTPLAENPKNMGPSIEAQYKLVRQHMHAGAFRQKGPDVGNLGSTTIKWARENVGKWLADLDPEVAVIMFGSNDFRQIEVQDYARMLREVVESCLDNGTIVLLTTPPPQTSLLEKSNQFAESVRAVARELSVPLIDYHHEILSGRPFDWDGSADEFKNVPGDTYEVPTLISRDGVHPSNQVIFSNDFSGRALASNGFGLRNYLTLVAYAEVISKALRPSAP